MSKENGFVHGSDLLVGIVEGTDENANVAWLGHSKSCTISSKSETKSRLHKEVSNDGMWEEKVVSKHSVSISAEGFVCYDADKMGYAKLVEFWRKGEPITVRYGLREASEKSYFEGKFVIVSLEETGPAEDDATYSISLENSGEVRYTVNSED